MTSPAKIRANRRIARRHGLAVPVLADPALAPEVAELARVIARSVAPAEPDAAAHDLACRIAEAMIDLKRVRLAKLPLVAALHADPTHRRTLTQLARLDRYERRALARRKAAIREFDAAVQSPPHTAHLAPPHPEERSRSERVSKDGPGAQAAPHRPTSWFETRGLRPRSSP